MEVDEKCRLMWLLFIFWRVLVIVAPLHLPLCAQSCSHSSRAGEIGARLSWSGREIVTNLAPLHSDIQHLPTFLNMNTLSPTPCFTCTRWLAFSSTDPLFPSLETRRRRQIPKQLGKQQLPSSCLGRIASVRFMRISWVHSSNIGEPIGTNAFDEGRYEPPMYSIKIEFWISSWFCLTIPSSGNLSLKSPDLKTKFPSNYTLVSKMIQTFISNAISKKVNFENWR